MKIFKKFIAAATAVSATLCAVSMNVSATGYTDKGNADAAVNKPKLTMDKVVVTKSDIDNNKEVTVNLSVSGANMAYASTGIHVYWDPRLKIAENPKINIPMVNKGDALRYLACGLPTKDPTAAQQGMDGCFMATAGSGNYGLDGVMWSFTFILPDDAKTGDVYPIDIVYKSNAAAHDLFINSESNTAGYNMQAYAFTKGIYSSDNPTFTANPEDIVRVPALANINKTYDGYIAVCSDNLLLGDANCDGKVTADDATAILQFIGNRDKYPLTEQGMDNADCCDRGNGITAMDAYAIQMIVAGSIAAKDLPVKSSDF